MGTFMGAIAFAFFVFLALYAANEADKKLNNAIKTTEKMKERLDVMEARLNLLFENMNESGRVCVTAKDILESYRGENTIYTGDNITGHC